MDILERFENIIKETANPIVFEIGCNDAYHTDMLNGITKKHHKDYRYFCFEPDDRVWCRILPIEKKHKPFVLFSPFALCDREGEITFHLSDGYESREGYQKQHFSGSSSIRKPTGCTKAWPDMKFYDKTVKCTTIDSFCKSKAVDHIDFIWMDTQGAEKDIFNGAKEMSPKIKYIYTEYEPNNYEGAAGLEEILLMLPNFELVENYGGDVLLRNKDL